MKINTENSLPLETNATLCEKDVFKFESSSSANMCEFVTKNLYKSPIQTLTQEYLSNARDAQREVDNDHTPIEVTLPTYQEPILKIRDFGPGMDSERIKVLLTFFESTKRGTNKFTGGFGVGAKSAFAYTDSFIIITHVNGTSYHYSAYINEDRFPELAPLSTIPESNKPNGTEIQIPVNQNDVDQFVQAALRCTYFWETKPSFTNLNKELHSWFFRDNAKYKVDNFQILNNESNFKKLFAVNNNYNNSGIIISLDGIPYYVDRELKEKLPAITELQKTLGFGILSVVHLKTGDCEVTGSRESIAQSDYTLQNLKPIFENIINQINIENEKLHKSAKTLDEFLKTRIYFNDFFKPNAKNPALNNFFSLDTKIEYNIDEYDQIQTKHSSHLTIRTVKLENRDKLKISAGSLYSKSVFYYVDTPMNDRALKIKLKKILLLNKQSDQSVRLILTYNKTKPEHPEASEIYTLLKELKVTFLSDISLPKEKRTPKPKTPLDLLQEELEKDQISIYRLDKKEQYYGSMSFINDTYSIKENSFKENTGYKFEKIVYTTVKHKKNDPSVDGFQKIGRALDHFQLAFGAISESSEKKIKNNQNFIKLEDFIQSIPEKVSEKLFDQYFLNKSLINELKYFKPFADQINDPIVKDFILRTQTIQDLNIPSETIELLLNNSPDLEKIREEAKERSERLRSRYPILWDSYIYNMLGQYNKESAKKAAEEMIFYMNSKLRDLNE